jgi:guanosine-3',5'-bis(diphosphate) 3'-pyrophosphohydrolase
VKTQRASSKIRRWFKIQARDQNINQGKGIFDKELRRLGLVDVNLDRLAKEFEYRNTEDLYEAVGCGDVALGKIVNHLTLTEVVKGAETDSQVGIKTVTEPVRPIENAVSVLGLKGLLSNIARCCNPAPGDDILGYITRGRGATIHRVDCPNIMRIRDRERLVKVSWGEPKSAYPVPVRIKAYDRNGLMKDVSTLISDEGINMSSVSVETSRNLAIFDLTLEVHDIAELSRILDRLENLPNVTEAIRVRPG